MAKSPPFGETDLLLNSWSTDSENELLMIPLLAFALPAATLEDTHQMQLVVPHQLSRPVVI